MLPKCARRLGYAVLWDESQQSRAQVRFVHAQLRRGSRPAIFLRPEPRPERVQWAIAHELGEACPGGCSIAWVRRRMGRFQNREQLANALATRLLLPMKWFARAAAELDHELIRLKERFTSASHELIAGECWTCARRLWSRSSTTASCSFAVGIGRKQRRGSRRPKRVAGNKRHDAGEVIRRRRTAPNRRLADSRARLEAGNHADGITTR